MDRDKQPRLAITAAGKSERRIYAGTTRPIGVVEIRHRERTAFLRAFNQVVELPSIESATNSASALEFMRRIIDTLPEQVVLDRIKACK